MPDPERLAYSVKEAVKATGLSRTTLYRMIRDGELPNVVVHSRRLIPAEALRNLITGVTGPVLAGESSPQQTR